MFVTPHPISLLVRGTRKQKIWAKTSDQFPESGTILCSGALPSLDMRARTHTHCTTTQDKPVDQDDFKHLFNNGIAFITQSRVQNEIIELCAWASTRDVRPCCLLL